MLSCLFLYDFSEEGKAKKESKKIVEIDKGEIAEENTDILIYPESNLKKPIDPDQYIIGPGDEFYLVVWGVVKNQILLFVGPEGNVIISEVGNVHVSGLTLNKARKKVVRIMKKIYPNQKFNFLLAKSRGFKVYILGGVNNPGIYALTPLNRVSEAVSMAGGISKSGTKRRIEIRRNGRTEYADLHEFEQRGNLKSNPYLLDNDIIFIPLSLPRVTIGGGIKKPGIYELEENEDLNKLISRVGGVTSNVSHDKPVKIIRLVGNKKRVLKTDLKELLKREGKSFQLADGDNVLVPSVGEVPYHETNIYLTGEVKKPGAYPYMPGYTVKAYIGIAGGLTSRARYSQTEIIKTDGNEIPLDENMVLETGDTIHVPEKFIKVWQDCLVITTSISSLTLAVIAAFK